MEVGCRGGNTISLYNLVAPPRLLLPDVIRAMTLAHLHLPDWNLIDECNCLGWLLHNLCWRGVASSLLLLGLDNHDVGWLVGDRHAL